MMKIFFNRKGMSIIETLIGIVLLAVVVGGILGMFTAAQYFFQDGTALARSQATARQAVEKILRIVREGSSYIISTGGNVLTVTGYGGTDTFEFTGNELKKNGNTFATDVFNITGENIFEEVVANELIGINFAVRNKGMLGHYQEVQLCVEAKLRNA